MKKAFSLFLSLVMLINVTTGLNTGFNAYADGNDVVSISYTPAEAKVIVENTNGYLTTEYNGNEYYCYYVGGNIGDKLTVAYKSGAVIDYVYGYSEDGYSQFASEDGQIISGSDVNFRDNQYENHWTLGSDNGYYVEYLGIEAYVPVTIIENPVSSISYTPVKEKVIVENTNGYLTTDYNGNEYYCYYVGGNIGDKLTLTYKSGAVIDYVYGYSEEGYSQFASEDGQIISWSDINFKDNQYENHWTLGSDNGYYVEYLGIEAYVPVTIIENPVSSISYTPVEEKVIVENTNGYLTTDYNGSEYYRYYVGGNNIGDKLTVAYKSGAVVDYVYGYSEEGYSQFASEDGQIISWSDVNFKDNQYENHWTLGSDNGYYVEYLGVEAYVPVTIIEKPSYMVQNITVGEIKEAVVFDNQYAEFLFVPEHDGVYAFYSTGSSDTYGYIYDSDGNNLAENNGSGIGESFSVSCEMEAGKTYSLRCKFLGDEQGIFNVSLKEINANLGELELDEIKNFSAESDADYYLTFTPNEDGFYSFEFSNISRDISLSLYDGNDLLDEKYVYVEYALFGPGSCVLAGMLKAGITYKVVTRASYINSDFSVMVTKPDISKIAGIELTNNEQQVVEYQNGWWNSGSVNGFTYEIEYFLEKTDLIINYTDGTSKTVNLGGKSGGFILDGLPVNIKDNQGYEHEWTVDTKDNIITVSYAEYSENINVTVVPSPVEKIEAKVSTKFIENSGGYVYNEYMGGSNREYYRYVTDNIPVTLTVYYTNGTSNTFTTRTGLMYDGYYVDCYSNQKYDNQWCVDNENMELGITYLGKTTTVKAEMVENPIVSLDVKQSSASELYDDDGEVSVINIEDLYTFDIHYSDGTSDTVYGKDVDTFYDEIVWLNKSVCKKSLVFITDKYVFDIAMTIDVGNDNGLISNKTKVTFKVGNISKTVNFDATGLHSHIYEAIKVDPTCTTQGYTTYICTVCGDSYVDNFTNPTGHSFNGGKNCVVCDAVNPNYVEPTPQPTPTQTTTTAPVQTTAQPTQTTTTTPVQTTTQPAQTTTTTPATTTVKKPKSTSISKLTKGKKQFEVTWKKVSSISGYQIQYSTDKKFKKNSKTVTAKKSSTSETIKKLKSKKTYYVRVRTYKTVKVNGKSTKVYSSWSKVKSVKTK